MTGWCTLKLDWSSGDYISPIRFYCFSF